MTTLVVILAVLAAATLAGWLLTRRSGRIREIDAGPQRDTGDDVAALGLSRDGPTVVHFSAPWCGPCDRVRRVVDQVCADLGGVAQSRSTWTPTRTPPAAMRCCRCPPR